MRKAGATPSRAPTSPAQWRRAADEVYHFRGGKSSGQTPRPLLCSKLRAVELAGRAAGQQQEQRDRGEEEPAEDQRDVVVGHHGGLAVDLCVDEGEGQAASEVRVTRAS